MIFEISQETEPDQVRRKSDEATMKAIKMRLCHRSSTLFVASSEAAILYFLLQ
jgi:hypothetical protein